MPRVFQDLQLLLYMWFDSTFCSSINTPLLFKFYYQNLFCCATIVQRTFALLLCIVAISHCKAQVLPAPGAKLNYNQVMFEYPKVKGAVIYVVSIEKEDTSNAKNNYCSVEQTDSATATMISGLEFGKKYHWKYAGVMPGGQLTWKGPYAFEITEDTLLNRNIMSIAVTKNDSAACMGGLIVNDCTHTIVDRNGQLVWYLTNVDWKFTLPRNRNTAIPRPTPQVEATIANANAIKTKFEVRPVIYDLRLTPYGTITDMEDSFPIERDLNCNVLWRAPNNGKVSGTEVEYYNHDFKRLPNGHYMVLGNEVWRKLPPYRDTAIIKKKYPEIRVIDGHAYGRVEFGTVIEYDKKGNVVWSWNCEQYFDSNALSPVIGAPKLDFNLKPHVNAFSVDRNNEFVYVGFRDVSRIVKVQKATGKVVDSWGQVTPVYKATQAVNFHQQHDASIMDNDNIAIFNNNDYPGRDSIPSVLIFSQKPGEKGNVVWKYDVSYNGMNRRAARTGGNVELLKNGNFLVCLGNLDHMFEITPDKKIVWEAEIKPNERRSFSYFHRLYRVHYVSSLYPCYFSFQTDVDTVQKRHSGFILRLFNKGTENDAYQVEISNTSGSFVQRFTTDTIYPNQSATFKIEPGKHLHRRDKITVSITSQTNPDFKRESIIEVLH